MVLEASILEQHRAKLVGEAVAKSIAQIALKNPNG
tara:strand:- start:2255 stop:2359 length:105 start_codon:yes stop_codon:yes gene_type:complete